MNQKKKSFPVQTFGEKKEKRNWAMCFRLAGEWEEEEEARAPITALVFSVITHVP
jgi:hypothetical protein